MSLPLATLTGLQWVVWLALLNNVAATVSAAAVAGHRQLVVGARRFRCCSSRRSGRMGIAVLGARMLIGCLKPGTYRRGGSAHLRVWLAERLGRGQRCREPGRRTVAGVLRAGAGQQGRQGRRPALGTAGDRHAHARPSQFDRAGGRPDRALDRRRPLPCRHASPSATTPPSARAPRCCPAPSSARTPMSRAGSGVVGKVKNGQYWKGSPAVKSGKARHPWPEERPRPRTVLGGWSTA